MVVYKYLGYGVTNENGVAKLDHNSEGQEISHSYTGVGAGEIDVVASLDNPVVEGSIVSETFSVLDTLLYDTGTDATHNIWTGDTSNLTRGSEYSRLEESASPTPTSINTVMPTGLWVLTMSIKRDGHSTNWDINILNNNVSVFGCATPTNDVWTDITLVYDGSKIYYFENGGTTPTKTTSVVLDDSKTTTLRLQTPQDITYLDFKDLIVLRESKSTISITSSNPIIQSGDTATITGSLYDNGLLVKNATLDVYKNGSKVGTASTGDSGVASYTYSGTGVGATELQFKYGNIVSEPFTVIDGIFYDKGILNDPQTRDWSGKTNCDWNRGNEYSTITPTDATSLAYIYYAPSVTDNICFELDMLVNFTSSKVVQTLRNNTSTKSGYSIGGLGLTTGVWSHVKFRVENGSLIAIVDGVSKTPQTISDSWNRFLLQIEGNSGQTIQFKNFVVYPI